tara:strand:- start:342 stop:602 length:261 start_codon:yes stop_codon:yes gene_type:complete
VFGFITGKIQTAIMAIGAVLLPILYILGRRDEKAIQKTAALEDALELEKTRSEFHLSMSEAKNEIDNSNTDTSRDALVERLRDKGL